MQNLGMLEMGHLYIITLKVMILLGVVARVPNLALGRPKQENQKFKDCQISCKQPEVQEDPASTTAK